jgi:hypothetical protein
MSRLSLLLMRFGTALVGDDTELNCYAALFALMQCHVV